RKEEDRKTEGRSGGTFEMISDSKFWKKELLREAAWLKKYSKSAPWNSAMLSRYEKSLFVGGFAVRKLLDSEKLTQKAKGLSVKATRYLWKGKPVTLLERYQLDCFYDFTKGEKCGLSSRDICNQLIHSFVFLPSFFEEDRGLHGFFLVSDKLRHCQVYFVTV